MNIPRGRRAPFNACNAFFAALTPLAVFGAPSVRARADASSLYWLSGTWASLADYATVGGCASAPADAGFHECGPARPAFGAREKLRATALLSATDILLEVADKLESEEQAKEAPVGKLLENYDHLELLADARVSYETPWMRAGVAPFRIAGQFLLHNPNLPLVSAALRQDRVYFAGTSARVQARQFVLVGGVTGRYLDRSESLVEASVVDFASQERDELVFRQRVRAWLADVGGGVEAFEFFNGSFQLRDLGRRTQGRDRSPDYLFVFDDLRPRFQGAFSLVPHLPWGRGQLGVTHIRFLDGGPLGSDRTFMVAGYFLGPTRLTGSWAPGFLRSALSVSAGGFGLGLAQEWVNRLQSPRGSKPRFTAEMEVSL